VSATVSTEPRWLVPFRTNGAPAADARWAWDELTCQPVEAKRTPPRGQRVLVNVPCPHDGCRRLLGRVDVAGADLDHPTFVMWLPGGQAGVTEVAPGRQAPDGTPRLSESYWLGRFALVRDGERAPAALWFEPTCPDHGPAPITSAELFAAFSAGRARPTRITGTIRAEDNAPR
jgi:hypothetical protein